MKNIVVVGGGTAGWLTALAAQKGYPECSITVIESREIGILGAGEASTTSLIGFLEYLDIAIEDLIKETRSTIKVGIKFNNFNEDDESYYHEFAINRPNPKAKELYLKNKLGSSYPVLHLSCMSENLPEKEYKLSAMALDSNNLPFVSKNENPSKISDFEVYNLYGIHFDARAMAKFLSEIAINRGVIHIDSVVDNFVQDNNENIESIKLIDGSTIKADFVFDCTGFYRVVNKKLFNTEWVSFSNNLPAKRAVPFFLDIDKDEIPAYTESTAMNYGWMWKIPLQHRYGCGYVFDSNYITDEQAILEIEEKLGHKIESPKTFSFEPGYYKTIWNKNTIAVGLSAGFVEPLEATSIMQSVETLSLIFKNGYDIFNPKGLVAILNKKYAEDCEEIRDFLYLHYMTNKTNTDFWANFTKNNTMPESLKTTLETLNAIEYGELRKSYFNKINYYIIMYGNKILDKEFLEKANIVFKTEKNTIEKINKNKKDLSNSFINHSEFIKKVGGFNE